MLTLYYGIACVSWKSLPVILFNTMANICLSYRLIFTFNEPHACFNNEIQDTAAKSLQSCLTLWDPMDCSLPGSFVHGDSPGWILEWIAMPSSRASSQPKDGTHISYVFWIGRRLGTMDWFKTGKGVHQGCILSRCLFNFYAEYIMRNARVDAGTSWNQDCWEKYQ